MKRIKYSVFFVALGLVAFFSCDYKPRNQGKAVYEQHCQSCHLENGQGLGALIPPVSNADFVVNQSDQLACIITKGMTGKVTVNGVEYDSEMPGNTKLTEVELTNLIHFLLVDLNQKENPYIIKDIRAFLKSCS